MPTNTPKPKESLSEDNESSSSKDSNHQPLANSSDPNESPNESEETPKPTSNSKTEVISNPGSNHHISGSPSKEAETKSTHPIAKRPQPKTGMIYLSRVPPGMDVTALRALLSRTGLLGRIWLRPKGNESNRRGASFRDGWVEYKSRKDAKRSVRLLNGQPMISGKRPGRWRDDLWCMKFLSGFVWEDLSKEVFGVARERTLKVREQVAAARSEKSWIEKRAAIANAVRKGSQEDRKLVRTFKQKSVIPAKGFDEDEDERKARIAAQRVDEDIDKGVKRQVETELLDKLFKKRRKL